MKKDYKVETIEEFMARGGKITTLEYKKPPEKRKVSSTVHNMPNLMTLDEGEFFYSDSVGKEKPKKELNLNDINMDIIPEYLKITLGLRDKKDK